MGFEIWRFRLTSLFFYWLWLHFYLNCLILNEIPSPDVQRGSKCLQHVTSGHVEFLEEIFSISKILKTAIREWFRIRAIKLWCNRFTWEILSVIENLHNLLQTWQAGVWSRGLMSRVRRKKRESKDL